MNNWQELLHVKENHFMSTRMLLTVGADARSAGNGRAPQKKALAAHQLQYLRVLPKIMKLSVNHFLFQLVLGCTWQEL